MKCANLLKMKHKHYIFRIFISIVIFFISFNSLQLKANTGDTLVVHGFSNFLHQSCNTGRGTFLFPNDTISYYRILLKYQLSCPVGGCDIYDRIATLKVLKPTGNFDSTLVRYPSFTANNLTPDSLAYMNDTSYSYSWNSTSMQIDSVAFNPITLNLFSDTSNPDSITQSLVVWPAYYNHYIFDINGNKTDSTYVSPDSVIYLSYDSVYVPFEIQEPFEIARSITPYGMAVNIWFDVTDYRPLLKDSVMLFSSVCGYSKGWLVTTDFYFIEGVPPMHCFKVTNLWNGTFLYGNSGDPIENHLQPITLNIDSISVFEKIRLITTGHGFGGYPNQNVAEFYDVHHSLDIDGVTFDQHLWRSDCGSNPLSAQGAPGYTSTWFYRRANWCPGSYVTPHDFNATPLVNMNGRLLTVDYNLTPYTVTGGPAGFYAPEYYIQSHLFEFDTLNYSNNCSLERVVVPTDAFEYKRRNPICAGLNPMVVIKNNGQVPLNSVELYYNVDGGPMSHYSWTGLLPMSDSTTVTLPPISFGSGSHNFKAYVDLPNGGNDEYKFDDTLRSNFNAVNILNTTFIKIRTIVDNSPTEVSWQLKDDLGNIIYARNNFTGAGLLYIDTVYLSNGCYEFTVVDAGGDGVCCYNGNGSVKLYKGSTAISFAGSGDYGDFWSYNFAIDQTLNIDEHLEDQFSVFPNPTSGLIKINTSFENGIAKIMLIDVSGRVVVANEKTILNHQVELNYSEVEQGLYFIRIEFQGKSISKRVLIIANH